MSDTTCRSAAVKRSTGETSVRLELSLDGNGKAVVSTGFGMLDHMLTLTTFWAGFDLTLVCTGDMHVDAHHTAEDVALCLGKALREALGNRRGIARVGWARVPMDEALADVTVDMSGRPWLEYRGDELLPPVMLEKKRICGASFTKGWLLPLSVTCTSPTSTGKTAITFWNLPLRALASRWLRPSAAILTVCPAPRGASIDEIPRIPSRCTHYLSSGRL